RLAAPRPRAVGDDAEGPLMAFERVKRTRRGEFQIRLPAAERELLRALPEQLREVLTSGDPTTDSALRRLFPAATLDDDSMNAEYERLTRGDLLEERLAALDTMERTLDAERLSEEELVAWLSAINDLRLVIGVRLDVTEETTVEDFSALPDDDPAVHMYTLYSYLTFLEDHVVGALSASR
ncbi:MAG TPA: DUF2017 family protein, partial [Actinomycetota bacterium]|nr:DUF2017 family protein [Actinomycetota bacterium]